MEVIKLSYPCEELFNLHIDFSPYDELLRPNLCELHINMFLYNSHCDGVLSDEHWVNFRIIQEELENYYHNNLVFK